MFGVCFDVLFFCWFGHMLVILDLYLHTSCSLSSTRSDIFWPIKRFNNVKVSHSQIHFLQHSGMSRHCPTLKPQYYLDFKLYAGFCIIIFFQQLEFWIFIVICNYSVWNVICSKKNFINWCYLKSLEISTLNS